MKKQISLVLAALLGAASLTACGGNGANSTTAAATTAAETETSGEAAETEAVESEAQSEASGELVKVVVGASPAPHAEILEAAKPLMEEKGFDLQVMVYSDYVQQIGRAHV